MIHTIKQPEFSLLLKKKPGPAAKPKSSSSQPGRLFRSWFTLNPAAEVLKRRKDGFWWIRITADAKWAKLHVVTWETANRPLTTREDVGFRDGDPCNCCLDNLYLFQKSPDPLAHEIKKAVHALSKLNKLIEKYEK